MHDTDIDERYRQEISQLELKNQELQEIIHELTARLDYVQRDIQQRERKMVQEIDKLKSQWQLDRRRLQEDHAHELFIIKEAHQEERELILKELHDRLTSPTIPSTRVLSSASSNNSCRALGSTLTDIQPCNRSERHPSCSQDKLMSPSFAYDSDGQETIDIKLSSDLDLCNSSTALIKCVYSSTDTISTADPLCSCKDDKSIERHQVFTRTMVGDWMWKYTRHRLRKENKHQRFFWFHPYTQMLYWSTNEPGNQQNEAIKNGKIVCMCFLFAYIIIIVRVMSFEVIQNEDLPSISIKTPSRSMKIQCLNRNSHYAWIRTLSCIFSPK